MGELLAILWPFHHERLCEGIYRLFNNKVGCDFQLWLNDDSRSIQAHSLIFQIFCPTLNSSHDNQQFRFEDEDICRDDVRCLMEFMYSGKTYVEAKRLSVVKRSAEKLGLGVFVDIIQEIMKKRDPKSSEVVDLPTIIEPAQEQLPVSQNNVPVSFVEEHNYVSTRRIEDEVPENEELTLALNFGDISAFHEIGDSEPQPKQQTLDEKSKNGDETVITKPQSSEAPPKKKLVCPVCDKVYTNKNPYLLHIELHNSKAKKKLKSCSFCTFKGIHLEAHLLSKHCRDYRGKLLEKSFKCDECDFSCVIQYQLNKHKLVKHTEPSIKCDHCSSLYHTNSDLNRHKKAVHGLRTFMCDICGCCYKSSRSLTCHKERHSAAKVTCDVCGIQIVDYCLKKHKREMHANAHKRFKCGLCNAHFKQRMGLLTHFKNTHKVKQDEIKSTMKANLIEVPVDQVEKKKKIPREKVSFICSVCEMRFTQKATLKRHMKKHGENSTVFKCKYCEYTAQEKYQLKAHIVRIHKTGEVDLKEMVNINDAFLSNGIVEIPNESVEMYIELNCDSTSNGTNL